MARKTRLTHPLIDAIAKRIRGGCFGYVAAGSFGIPRSTYYDWLARGEQEPGSIFSELLAKVEEAGATARHNAESRVYKEAPLSWLRLGPGREAWCEKTQIDLQGHLHHNGLVQCEPPVNPRTLAEMCVLLEEMQIIAGPGPALKQLAGLQAGDDDVVVEPNRYDGDTNDGESKTESGPSGSGGNGRPRA